MNFSGTPLSTLSICWLDSSSLLSPHTCVSVNHNPSPWFSVSNLISSFQRLWSKALPETHQPLWSWVLFSHLVIQWLMNNVILLANSVLFTKSQRGIVMISNAGIAFMIWGVWRSCQTWGAADTFKYYGLPWLLVTHWCEYLIFDEASNVSDALWKSQNLDCRTDSRLLSLQSLWSRTSITLTLSCLITAERNGTFSAELLRLSTDHF